MNNALRAIREVKLKRQWALIECPCCGCKATQKDLETYGVCEICYAVNLPPSPQRNKIEDRLNRKPTSSYRQRALMS